MRRRKSLGHACGLGVRLRRYGSHPIANMLEIGIYQNKWNLSYQQNAQGQRGETSYRTVPITTQKWICLEWELNDSPEEINL